MLRQAALADRERLSIDLEPVGAGGEDLEREDLLSEGERNFAVA